MFFKLEQYAPETVGKRKRKTTQRVYALERLVRLLRALLVLIIAIGLIHGFDMRRMAFSHY